MPAFLLDKLTYMNNRVALWGKHILSILNRQYCPIPLPSSVSWNLKCCCLLILTDAIRKNLWMDKSYGHGSYREKILKVLAHLFYLIQLMRSSWEKKSSNWVASYRIQSMFQNTDTRNRPILDELQMIPLMLIQRKKLSIFPPPSPSPARGNPEILALLKSLWHILELAKMKMIHLIFPMMFKNVFCSSSKYKAARKLSVIYINKYCRKNLWSGRSWVNTSA